VSAFEEQRTLLYASITDISSSVKANDAKASAALVVHGLLFAGILNVVTKLDHAYGQASHRERILGVVLLGVTLAAFLCSILLLLLAVSPYRPKKLETRIGPFYPHVFFPVRSLFRGSTPHESLRQRVASLDEDAILDELTAEVLKLADILAYESDRAKWGYRALLAEVFAAAAFLVTVAFTVL